MSALLSDLVPYIAKATPKTPIWWPAKYKGETRDFSLDISHAIDPNADRFETVTAACAPSGDGELVLSNLFAVGFVITLTTSVGQPTRIYDILLTITMTNNRIYEFLVNQAIPQAGPSFQVPMSPNPGFGPAIIWTADQGVIAIYGQSQYNTHVVYR